jgi:hypothetical protein
MRFKEVHQLSHIYEVRVHGEASVLVIETLSADVEMQADTIIHAEVEDQAELQALLAQIRDIGLELVHLRRVS